MSLYPSTAALRIWRVFMPFNIGRIKVIKVGGEMRPMKKAIAALDRFVVLN